VQKPAEPPDPPPVISEIPVPETGPVTLDAAGVDPPRAAVSFDAPRELGISPAPPAGRPKPRAAEPLARYRGVFADAVARIARLQAEILDLARGQAAAEIDAAASRAAAVQRDLDAGLDSLDAALTRARLDLDARVDELTLRLDAEADAARTAIRTAARRAHGAVAAASVRLAAERDAIGRQYWDPLVTLLDTQAGDIRTAADTAIAALATVGRAAAERFPESGAPLQAAQNEEKLIRLPARSRTESHQLELARDYDAHLIEAKKPAVAEAKTHAMQPLVQKVEALRTEAPGAIARAQREALHQLDKQVHALRNVLVSGRAGGHAMLLNQHRATRAQMIASARERMTAQQNEARARLGGNQAAAGGMAGGMPVAARSLHGSLAAQRQRPVEQFAQIVISASTTLVNQLEVAAPGRLAQLRRSGLEGATAQAAAVAVAHLSFESAARVAADNLTAAAAHTAEQMDGQLTPALPGFAALATPVAHSIDSFIRPLAQSCKRDIDAMAENAKTIRASLVSEYTDGVPTAAAAAGAAAAVGSAGGAALAVPAAVPAGAAPAGEAQAGAAQGAAEQPAPKEAGPTPGGFVSRMQAIPQAPLDYPPIAELVTAVDSKVSDDVERRAFNLHNRLAASDVSGTFVWLRGLTRLRGRAVETRYDAEGEDLRSDIRSGLTKLLSSHYTDEMNIASALAYLDGNAAEGARLEMQLAIHLWNDNERVKLAARGLTREQMQQLESTEAGRATLDDVHGDLNEATQEVFDALRAGDTDRADAIELRQRIDSAREKAGQEGADRTADAIAEASQAGVQGALSGADPLGLGLDADRGVADPSEHWRRVQREFAGLRSVTAAVPAARGTADPAATLVAYATRTMDYWVQTNDPSRDADLRIDQSGRSYELVHQGITDRPNRDLIEDLARHGEGSPETRASRMAVEMQRAGGPDMERLNTATYDPRMNPELAMDPRDPQAAQHAQAALERARADREETLRIYAHRYAPALEGNPQAVRQLLAAQAQFQITGDPDRAKYAAAMVSQDRPDPLLALNYALNGDDTRMDVLRRTMGSLRRDQLDDAVRRYNAEAKLHGRPTLEDRLGLYGRHGGDITGDETQEVERLMLGVAVTDRERAEVAALQARQQLHGEGWLGRGLNTLGGEQQRLERNYGRLLTAMGVAETDFDERGRLRVRDPVTGATAGHFEPNGVFRPTATASLDTLNAAMIGARLSAEGYKEATDRMASYITTALMVIAAVVTTALTGGAAAGFWAVALTATAVTLTAGVVGIGATWALKGDRYTAHEAEHDLAVAAVQAATAGIGAGLGVVLKGAAIAAGRVAPTLLQEIAVGAGTSAVGSAGQAAIEHRNVGDAFLRGMFGGALGAAAARPFGRLLSGEAGQIEKAIVRSATSATSGAASRAGEIAYETGTGEDTRSLGEKIEDVKTAAAQNAIQGALEHAGEHVGEEYRARRDARGAAAGLPPIGHGTRPSPDRPVVPAHPLAEVPAAARAPALPERPPAEPEAEPHIPAAAPPERPAIPPPAPVHPVPMPEIPPQTQVPAPPIMPTGPHVEPFAPTIRPPVPEVEPHAPTVPAPPREGRAPAVEPQAQPRPEGAEMRPRIVEPPERGAPSRPLETERPTAPMVEPMPEPPAIRPPAPVHPVPMPEIPGPMRAPGLPIMPEGPLIGPSVPTSRPPAAEPHGPTVPAMPEQTAAPPATVPGAVSAEAARARAAAHEIGEGAAAAILGSREFGLPAGEVTPAARAAIQTEVDRVLGRALAGEGPARVLLGLGDEPGSYILASEVGNADMHLRIQVGNTGGDPAKFEPHGAVMVVTVSEAHPPAAVERALAHELTELAYRRGGPEKDALSPTSRPGEKGHAVELSGHDRGRLAELEVIGRRLVEAESGGRTVEAARLRDEAQQLVAHLGLAQEPGGRGALLNVGLESRLKMARAVFNERSPARALLEAAVEQARRNPFLQPQRGEFSDIAVLARRAAHAANLELPGLEDDVRRRAINFVREAGIVTRDQAGTPIVNEQSLRNAHELLASAGLSGEALKRAQQYVTGVANESRNRLEWARVPPTDTAAAMAESLRMQQPLQERLVTERFGGLENFQDFETFERSYRKLNPSREPLSLQEGIQLRERLFQDWSQGTFISKDGTRRSLVGGAFASPGFEVLPTDLMPVETGGKALSGPDVERWRMQREDARVAGDTAKVNAASEALGLAAARDFAASQGLSVEQLSPRTKTPGADVDPTRTGARQPDVIATTPPGTTNPDRITVIEAKGGTSERGVRTDWTGTRRVEQGTLEYLETIAHEMDRPGRTDAERRLGRQILDGLRTGTPQIDYLEVRQPIGTGKNLPPYEVNRYDLRKRTPSS
jgi:hypothetical protein